MSLSFYPQPQAPTTSTSKSNPSSIPAHILSSFRDRSISLPTLSSFKTKDLRNGHRSSVRGLGWSIDGRKLATCSADRTIRIWVPERSIDHRASTELRGHTDSVDQLVWHPKNPEVLATASGDKTVRIWDTRINAEAGVVNTPGANINITYHPSGDYIAVGDKSDTVSIIDTRQGKVLHTVCSRKIAPTTSSGETGTWTNATVGGSYDEINELSFSPDGSLLYLSSGSGSIHIHHTQSNQAYTRIDSIKAHTSNIFCIQPDPLSRFIATASSDAMISLWDSREWFSHKMITSLTFPARAIGFSYDGEILASGGEDPVISVNATNPGNVGEDQVWKIPLPQGTMINTLAWHPNKYVVAYAGDEGNKSDVGCVRVWGL